MIIQNETIALEIVRRMEKMTSLELFLSFSVEEWEEYLLFLIYQSRDSYDAYPVPEMGMEIRYEFPIERSTYTGKGARWLETTTIWRTFQSLREEIMPVQKKQLSQAFNNLLIRHKENADFLRIALSCFRHDAGFHNPEGRMVSYEFSTLHEIIESEVLAIDIKEDFFRLFILLQGLEKPAHKAFLKTLLHYKEVFHDNGTICIQIFYLLFEEGWYKEAFSVMRHLTVWPMMSFRKSIATMLTSKETGTRVRTPVTVEYVIKEIIPHCNDTVKSNLAAVLKECFVKEEAFKRSSENSFPASQYETFLIEAL